MQAWQRICEASRKEFELIYQRLGVTIQERGESFYNPFLAPLVEELLASGVAVESEGAKVHLLLPSFLWAPIHQKAEVLQKQISILLQHSFAIATIKSFNLFPCLLKDPKP